MSIDAACRLARAHASTLLFAFGLIVLCASVAQWSRPVAGMIAGGTLMLIGAMPTYVMLSRGASKAQKD